MAPTPALTRAAVGAAYASQAFGYAALTTSLPALRDRTGLDDGGLSIVILCMTVGAALGTLVADWIAVRSGSRAALVTGLAIEATAMLLVASLSGSALLIPMLMFQGLGLGLVDAACNMQGSLAERAAARPLFGRFSATATAAGIVSTLVTFAVLFVAAAIHATGAVLGARFFDPARAAKDPQSARPSVPLARAGILMVGLVVFAAFVIDTAVSTWGTVYSQDVLRLEANLTPLGYGCYLAAVLAARLVADPLIARWGRAPLALTAAASGIAGCLALVLGAPAWLALVGFALAGFGAGWLVPLAFGRAGELVPGRSDEVIARVNLFNYAAAVIGAVIPGVIAMIGSLQWAFILPALVLVACLPVLRRPRHPDPTTSV
ncbi:MFS transporter [Galactobacter valiniphilus]|uniref:MFS transporter n=1 Tax=Galactobacter valiniphilus TaxID=2676122 RepID=UPI003735AD07